MGGEIGRHRVRAIAAATARRVVPHLGGRTAGLALRGAALLREGRRGAESLAREAGRRFDVGDLDRGAALAEVVVAHAASTPALRASVLRAQARALVRAGRPDNAVGVLEQVVRARPDATEPVVELLTAAAAAGDADTVRCHLDGTRDRLTSRAVDRLLGAFVAAGLWEAAEDVVTWDRASDDTLVAARDRAGEASAPPRLLSAIDAARDAAPAWFRRGERAQAAGDLDQAIAAYEAALARDGSQPAWSYALGRALLEAGRPDAATAALEAALARRPDDPEWRYRLGMAHRKAGRRAEALEAFELSLAGDRTSTVRQTGLAGARRRAGAPVPVADGKDVGRPTADQLRDVTSGIVALPRSHVIVGWVPETDDVPQVTIRVSGVVVARTRATELETLADGHDYHRFRREVKELWHFLGGGDELTVEVDGSPLPFVDGRDRFPVELDRASCLDALRDRLDAGYVLDKYGRLRRSIQVDDVWQQAVIGLFHRLRRDMYEGLGVELFPFYGTLLGAIREGDFLGHDDDFDTTYVATGSTPDEVRAEYVRLCRLLIDRGYTITARAWHVWVAIPGTRSRLDIFFSWFDEDDRFHVGYGYHGRPVHRSDAFAQLVPAKLGAHEVVVPANAEDLLAQVYGDGWMQPDPGFTHKGPTRVLDERYRVPMDTRNEVYWLQFYRDHQIQGGSTFATWVTGRFSAPWTLVEFGCGTGRDSLYFASQGYRVFASDRSPEALKRAEEARERAGLDSVSFHEVEAGDADQVRRFLSSVSEDGPVLVYLRFVLHSVPVEVEDVLLDTCVQVLGDRLRFCTEFRTVEDEARSKVYGGHQRRYLDHQAFITKLTARWGFEIDHVEAGTGLSVFKGEDPYLARIVAHGRSPAASTAGSQPVATPGQSESTGSAHH